MGLSSFKITTMTPLSVKTYPALLCGIFLFLILETKSEWTANENIPHTTAAEQLITGHLSVTPVHTGKSLAEVTANTSLHNTPSPNVVDMNSVTTITSNDHPGLPHTTDKTTPASEEQSGSVSGTEKPPHTETASTNPLSAHPSEVPNTAASPTKVKSTEQKSTLPPKNPTTFTTAPETPVSTTGLPPVSSNIDNTSAATVTKWPKKQLPENSTAFTTALKTQALTTGSAPTSNNSTTSLPKNNTRLATTASATQTTLSAISGKPNITIRDFNQSTPTTELLSSTVNATNGTTLVIHTETTQNTKTFTTTTAHPLMSQQTTGTSISATAFSNKSITEISSTVFSTVHNATNATEGIWIPVLPKKLSTSKPKSTTVTESPQSTDAQACKCIGVAKQCLYVIAVLAAVAIIFIISTIVLCIKQSSRKYKVRRHQQGTEMMCISSLLPETSNHRRHNYTRQRSPVPNGVLVIHNCGDSDDDMGDNLTLSSFLPDNDRYV